MDSGSNLEQAGLVVFSICPNLACLNAGNGHDSQFLARHVGPSGRVFAFDIQAEAMDATKARIDAHFPQEVRPHMEYRQLCHSKLQEEVGSHAARVICFNLGFLPQSGNKSRKTTTRTTLQALEAAYEVLKPGGLVSVLCYTAHEGGYEEYAAVMSALEDLPPSFWVTSQIKLLNRPTAPVLLNVWKRSQLKGHEGSSCLGK